MSESAGNLAKIRDLVAMLDRPLSSRVREKVYPVYSAEINNLAKELGTLLQALGISSELQAGIWADALPLADHNSLAIVAQVTKHTGFAVELPPAPEVAETTAEIKNEPLEEELRQILDSLQPRGYIIEVRETAKLARVLFADDAPSKLSPLTPANPAGDIPSRPEAGKDQAARPSAPVSQASSPPPEMEWVAPPDQTDGK